MIELNKMTTIEVNLDAIMNRMNNHEKKVIPVMKWELWKVLSRKVLLI